MMNFILHILLIFVGPVISDTNSLKQTPSRSLKQTFQHRPGALSTSQIVELSNLSNVDHMNEVLDNICVVRIVGTPGHKRVKKYIKQSMKNLNWTVESDVFEEPTPTHGNLIFENIIATLNPNATRYLALACHYDSKYTRERNFIGATDSAVPCAQMINLAKVMNHHLDSIRNNDLSLMLIFFDGEEAFKEWGPTDSIYGARHLAGKWYHNNELDKLELLILLDLIGAPDPTFYNYFSSTEKWYQQLMLIESTLAKLRKFESYSYEQPAARYFQQYSMEAHIEDDHIPFLRRATPVLHLIPYPFPTVWHKPTDNRDNIDLTTTENINKILRTFIAVYLHIDV